MLHGSRSTSPENDIPPPVTYVEEQEILRKSTIAAFHGAIPEGEGDDFLIAREKTKDELEVEAEEYRAFLEREVGDLKNLVRIDDDSESHKGVVNGGQEDETIEKADKKGRRKKKKMDGSESGGAKQKKTKAEKDQEFLLK
jgi:protein KRI1